MGLKVTVAVWVTLNRSLASLAVRMESPVVDDFTVNVATPLAVVVPETVATVSVAPLLEERVTAFPETRLL